MKSKNVFIKIVLILSILIVLGIVSIFIFHEDILNFYKSYKYNKLTDNYILDSQFNQDVTKYCLYISLYPEDKFIKGKCEIDLNLIKNYQSSLILNFADNMNIDSLFVNGIKNDYEREDNHIYINLINPQLSSSYKINLFYQGNPKDSFLGGFKFDNGEFGNVIYTLNEPWFASTWFPCNDKPDDKALIELKIEGDSQYVSLSNGKLIGTESSGKRKVYHWKSEYPISTYLISINSADYRTIEDEYISENDTLPLFYYVFPSDYAAAKFDFQIHKDAIKIFSQLFGEYPFINEKYGVVESTWKYGAMENQTLTTIGSDFISGKRYFTDMLVHELAHHWWGNAVGPDTWKDIWLNEGFATYCEAIYFEKLSGQKALISTMNSKVPIFSNGTLYDPGENMFNNLVYDKGAWVLHMLRFQLGDSVFFKCLQSYFEKYKYKSASTEQFKIMCEEVSGINLDKFFSQWVFDGQGFIELNYSLNNRGGVLNLQLDQVQKEYDNYNFPLQIDFLYNDKTKIDTTIFVNSVKTLVALKNRTKPDSIVIDPNSWLLIKSYKKD